MKTVAAEALSYVLMTAARDEAGLIEHTLRSVVRQTVLPLKWLIVSDGSTDGTDELVAEYARKHPWIELHRLETGPDRDFASKAIALNAAYARLRHLRYDVIGNVDADMSFDEDHFELLLRKFAETPELGVAGIALLNDGATYDYRFASIDHVSGGCQLFRRTCLEQLGGFVPSAIGGVDWIAVTTARMNGWKTRTFVERVAVHHRPVRASVRDTWFRRGERDYAVGFHPLWEIARGIYQSTSRPYVIGGSLLLAGYASAFARHAPRPVSNELIRFNRREQMQRLRRIVTRLMPLPRDQPRLADLDDASLAASIDRLQAWVEGHEYQGYEPFDGLSSPLRPLTFGNRRLEQALLQIGRQSPLNLRPLLGVRPLESTKGRGYMAWGYLARFDETGAEEYRTKAVDCLEWLIRNQAPLYAQPSWGNHFDYASRAGKIARDESTIVWTALIGQAFLDGYEILGDGRYLGVARGICDWISSLPREQTPAGTCLSYVAARQLSIHNSNLLGAAMLARTAKHTGDRDLLAVAGAAVEYTCSRQRPDGSWYYGDDPTYHWIDCFHTGYNLDSLRCYIACAGDERYRPHLQRGFRYFKETFIESDGRPRYYDDRAYPIDIQCAAQAIETLAKFAGDDPEALPAAERVAGWTIAHMQDPAGHFHYRQYPLLRAKIPMLHWGQATMFRALALLSLKRTRRSQ